MTARTVALLFLAAACALEAQAPPSALLETAEAIRLARTAAPAEVSAAADIWALRATGYERVVEGSNGWSCMVEFDHPESLAPMCYDPEGTRTIVPWTHEVARMTLAGMSYAAATDSADALYASGHLALPDRPVLAYMLSREQRLYATPSGPFVGAWRPHVMIFHTDWELASLAAEASGGVITFGGEQARVRYLVVPVERWSDGSPAGGS